MMACSVTLVTVQDIVECAAYWNTTPGSKFNDTQAIIREFCKDAYQDWDISYVLIGGDGEWIPPRMMSDRDIGYPDIIDSPSDIYWSNLDFTFNCDNDLFWGEYGDSGFDLYAELFIDDPL